jgi:hypothetical protein
VAGGVGRLEREQDEKSFEKLVAMLATVDSRQEIADCRWQDQVQDGAGLHGAEAGVVLAHHGVGHIEFEALQPHDPLFQRALRNDAIDIDDSRLSDPVRSVHGLQVLHGVVVVLQEYHSVGACEVEAQTPDVCG